MHSFIKQRLRETTSREFLKHIQLQGYPQTGPLPVPEGTHQEHLVLPGEQHDDDRNPSIPEDIWSEPQDKGTVHVSLLLGGRFDHTSRFHRTRQEVSIDLLWSVLIFTQLGSE